MQHGGLWLQHPIDLLALYANWCVSKVAGEEWYDALPNQFFKALHLDMGECYCLVVIEGGDICFFEQRDLEDFRQDG